MSIRGIVANRQLMGGREETISDEEILRVFEDADDPVLSTTDVATEIEFSNSGAGDRLHPLADSGYLERKEVGRTLIWWLTEAGEELIQSDQ